jgi:hypothetical protein
MSALLYRPEFLGPANRHRVLAALDDCELRWLPAAELGRTAGGESLQLASAAEHGKAPMRRVATLIASRVFDALQTSGIPTPPAEEITPQVFPVKMYGSPNNPPRQSPHRDHAPLGYPRLTCNYYPLVEDARGGELVLHAADRADTARYLPSTDLLVAIDGDTLHSVEPLTYGRRYTVVANFYWQSGAPYPSRGA